MKIDKLSIFINRMKKIGIYITLSGNYPWVYIESINGKRVIETFMANHGFTVAFVNKEVEFTDIPEVFKLIRKYL